jgi:hypothetical protein
VAKWLMLQTSRCSNRLWSRLAIATKESAPRNVGRWHRLLPQMSIATNWQMPRHGCMLRQAISTNQIVETSECCHGKTCGNFPHGCCNRSLCCHNRVFVAIAYYHTCNCNACQRTSFRGNRCILPQNGIYCDNFFCCNRPDSL